MKTISKEDHMKLIGLLTVAAQHQSALEAIERAACEITGDEPQSGGHTGDAVYAGYGPQNISDVAHRLMTNLKITVSKD